MTKFQRFSINEIKRDGKTFISIICDENQIFVSTEDDKDLVKIERLGPSPKSYTQTGEIHTIASDLCEEFIQNGTLDCEFFQLDYAEIPIPKTLQKIHCNQFKSSYLGDQRVLFWLEKVEGPLEILLISEIGPTLGIGKLEQLKMVEKELILCASDLTDEELAGSLRKDYGTLVLNSEKITENGVKRMLENFFERPWEQGNHFEIRFKPSIPDFDKNELFKYLVKAEIIWKQYFEFKLSFTLNSGRILEYQGYYFSSPDGYHLVKIVIPKEWKPRIRDGMQ